MRFLNLTALMKLIFNLDKLFDIK